MSLTLLLDTMYPIQKTTQKTAALPPKLILAIGNSNGRETRKAARNATIIVINWRNESVMNPKGRTFLSNHASSGHQIDSDIQVQSDSEVKTASEPLSRFKLSTPTVA